VLNRKRADAEGSRSRRDGSKRPLYSSLGPTPDYDTPILLSVLRLRWRNGKAKAARNRAFGDVPDQPGGWLGLNYLGR
jgi:hypothetical protein